ncbi:MAG: LuxR C-terminal-related transcriptional regulator [Novosphingobium sp.]
MPCPPDPGEGPLSALLASLYDGIAQDCPWEIFLGELAARTAADFAVIVLAAPGYRGPGVFVSPGTDREQTQAYVSELFGSDPFTGLPEGEVTRFAEFVTPERVTPEFRAYLECGGGTEIIGADVRGMAGWEARIRLTREAGRPPFDDHVRALLKALIPHIRIASGLFGKLRAAEAEDDVYRGTIEQMAFALLILDRQGGVLRTNQVADRLLADSDGMRLVRGHLALDDRAAAGQLARLLAAPPKARAVRIRIPMPSMNGELAAIARAVPMPDYLAARGAVLALFVSDPDGASQIDPAALEDLFLLTSAEAELAALLAGGLSLHEAAQALSISYNTGRAHLRAIFAKCGVHRQAELVNLLRASVAGIA